MSSRVDEQFTAARGGSRRDLARLVTLVERGGEPAREISRLASGAAAGVPTIGITGAPGAGKSTLTSALIGQLRARGERVGVLAIDPTSPFSGGAILGDRVRMQDHVTDDGVFIRSMATRGHLGGLSLATPEAVRLLDAMGFDRIVVETVGVGQVEVEIVGKADTTVVVVNPGWGDSVQANKAGLMEVADVFAINKADRPGADQTDQDLRIMLDLVQPTAPDAWRPPIVRTVATESSGAAELLAAIDEHAAHSAASGQRDERRRRRAAIELNELVVRRLEERARQLCTGERWDELTAQVLDGALDPWAAADEMLAPVDA